LLSDRFLEYDNEMQILTLYDVKAFAAEQVPTGLESLREFLSSINKKQLTDTDIKWE